MTKQKRLLGTRRLLNALMGASALFAMNSTAQAASPNMHTSGYTTQPIGHYNFCKELPGECRSIGRNIAAHKLTRDSWRDIVDINNRVNVAVRPLTDMEIWGEIEVWSFPSSVGDCEDYVLLKRQMLIEAGINPANLLATVVRQANGEGHAVLTVRTDRGDFILDNLEGSIKEWRDTPYQYLKRQASDHAGRWVTIEDTRNQVARN